MQNEQEKKQRDREYSRRYYQLNKGRMNKKNREWAKKNPEKRKAIIEKHVANNKDKILDQKRRYRENNREALNLRRKQQYYKNNERKKIRELGYANKRKAIEYLGDLCYDCNKSFPDVCYDFHHVDPATKFKDVCQLLKGAWELIEIEIKKCVLLCSNCHRIRHAPKQRKSEGEKSPEGYT